MSCNKHWDWFSLQLQPATPVTSPTIPHPTPPPPPFHFSFSQPLLKSHLYVSILVLASYVMFRLQIKSFEFFSCSENEHVSLSVSLETIFKPTM